MKPRRKRFYYEIHLAGAVVEGIQLFTGMLEAERVVDERSRELSMDLGKPFRGFMIMRLSRRKSN